MVLTYDKNGKINFRPSPVGLARNRAEAAADELFEAITDLAEMLQEPKQRREAKDAAEISYANTYQIIERMFASILNLE